MPTPPPEQLTLRLEVNGRQVAQPVEPRMLLADFLRHSLRLTGTHVGCAQGVCGACTILLDGEPVRSCTLLAVQAEGASITTVEGLAEEGAPLPPLHRAFHECHGLQCGFCTPGMLIAATHLLRRNAAPTPDEVRAALAGNLCRCTGYTNILRAVARAAELQRKGP